MSTEALNYMITINENFSKATQAFEGFSDKVNSGLTKVQKSLSGLSLRTLIDNVNSAADGINAINEPGLKLNSQMHDLQAITGVAGQKLKEIEGYARQNALTFGGSAYDGVESYKLILSQLSPEIAKVPKALKAMGDNVSMTSKLMGGDQVAATNLLTTAMNQYGVSLEDPIQASKVQAQMMNVMAAAAKEGSAELPQIQEALQQSGMAAAGANVHFEETNAAIQVLDKAGKKGAEGGVALRNVLATLSEGRFLPKEVISDLNKAGVDVNTLGNRSLTLADRLKPLRKIMDDQALVTKLFGKENMNAALALVNGIDEQERLTQAITGTNVAHEQAAIVMESQEEKNSRLKAKVDDFKISLFNATEGWMGYASVIGDVGRDLTNMAPIFSGAANIVGTLVSAQKRAALWSSIVSGATAAWTVVQGAFNAVMALNPIVLVVLAVAALVAAIIWVASITEGWGKAWTHTVNGAKDLFMAYVLAVKANFNTMVNAIMIGIDKIKLGWYKFKEAVGLGDSSQNQAMINEINADVETRKASISDGYKKAAEAALKARDEFAAAIDSVHMKKDGKKDDQGIQEPGIPGAVAIPGKGGGSAGSSAKKSNEAVATGGTKHNYITINLKDLIGNLSIQGKDFKDSATQMQSQVEDALVRVLASATTAAV